MDNSCFNILQKKKKSLLSCIYLSCGGQNYFNRNIVKSTHTNRFDQSISQLYASLIHGTIKFASSFLLLNKSALCIITKYTFLSVKIYILLLTVSLGAKPCACHQSKFNKFIFQTKSKKANNHLMLVWFIDRHQFKFTLSLFDLRDVSQGKHIIIQFQFPQNLQNFWFSKTGECQKGFFINNIWQKKRGQFLMTLQSCVFFRRHHLVKILRLQTKNGQVYQSKINLNFWTNTGIRVINLGDFCVFVTISHYTKHQQTKHIIYVSNKAEAIIAIEQHRYICKVQYINLYFPKYNPHMIYSTVYAKSMNKSSNDSLKFIKKYIFSFQQVALHFLLNTNQDFDDELLKDSVQLIDTQKFDYDGSKELQKCQQGQERLYPLFSTQQSSKSSDQQQFQRDQELIKTLQF